MDEDHKFDDSIVKQLFENGLMGVEADPEFGGSGCNFLTMNLVTEELSKVDKKSKKFRRY
jgi:short-chain 2-methylacyl-CoA dehydrogenase